MATLNEAFEYHIFLKFLRFFGYENFFILTTIRIYFIKVKKRNNGYFRFLIDILGFGESVIFELERFCLSLTGSLVSGSVLTLNNKSSSSNSSFTWLIGSGLTFLSA